MALFPLRNRGDGVQGSLTLVQPEPPPVIKINFIEKRWLGELRRYVKRRTMSATAQTHRIDLSPKVRTILEDGSQQSRFLKHFLRYIEALLAPDPAGIDGVANSDVRCHELEAMGVPPGREGLKMFRRQVNAAIPDEHVSVTAVRFEGDDIIEADMVMDATQTGEIFGIPPTGRKVHFDVHERCRFVDGKLAERWAQVDIEDIKRQLNAPTQQV